MKRYFVCTVLILYFTFTSGMVYELFKCESTNRMVIPYSIPLSAERTGLSGIFTKDDMNCMRWVIEHSDGLNIIADYNVSLLVTGYLGKVKDYSAIAEDKYIFVSDWNARHKEYVEGSGLGLRIRHPLPENLGEVVYQSGKATIYKVIALKPD
jgi:hypothetical protein